MTSASADQAPAATPPRAGQTSTSPGRDCGLLPLEAILKTDELWRRPQRAPDHENENRALARLTRALGEAPQSILQTLADTTLDTLSAESAGLSLLTDDGSAFYWAAIAGSWSPHLGGGTPRDFGPCGDVLDRDAPLLFTHWEKRYPYLAEAVPLAEEGLLVPFHVDGRAVGTIWVIAHSGHRRFDAEDLRQLESMARFASAAYRTVKLLDAHEASRAALESLQRARWRSP
jgi:GAF domain-containing protein